MSETSARTSASFREMFTPKLVTVLREGYGFSDLKADIAAGLTVAIVALPLSMAIAIASGTTPDRGIITAIVGGFLISALGGSRFQIGGPAGAFIPLIASTIALYGIDGLIIATFMAGMILVIIGYLQLGTLIRYIPYPVTVGFTAGIGVIIFGSQLRDLLGLRLSGAEPPDLVHKIPVLMAALPTVSVAAVGLAVVSITAIFAFRRFRPRWPGLLIVVAFAAIASTVLHLPVETIGSRFGVLSASLPMPGLPSVSFERVVTLLRPAFAIALLGGIESLLSAVVADGMSGRRHRSNCELVAQGFGNMGSALFGGIAVTGTIARTATNVRANARGPISGILHAIFLLVFMMLAGGLMAYVPLAVLAAVLAVVAWNMIEIGAIQNMFRSSRSETVVLLIAFTLTVLVDLIYGIVIGTVLGSLIFMHRMAEQMKVGTEESLVSEVSGNKTVITYRLNGALFYGAATQVGVIFDRMNEFPDAVILDLSAVTLLDVSGRAVMDAFAEKANHRGAKILVAGAAPGIRDLLMLAEGPLSGAIHFASVTEAKAALAAS